MNEFHYLGLRMNLLQSILVIFQLQVMSVLLLKEFDTDFLGDNLSSNEIFLSKTKSHLLQDKFDLFINIFMNKWNFNTKIPENLLFLCVPLIHKFLLEVLEGYLQLQLFHHHFL